MTSRRLASGGLIDRARPIRFSFDNRMYVFAGFAPMAMARS